MWKGEHQSYSRPVSLPGVLFSTRNFIASSLKHERYKREESIIAFEKTWHHRLPFITGIISASNNCSFWELFNVRDFSFDSRKTFPSTDSTHALHVWEEESRVGCSSKCRPTLVWEKIPMTPSMKSCSLFLSLIRAWCFMPSSLVVDPWLICFDSQAGSSWTFPAKSVVITRQANTMASLLVMGKLYFWFLSTTSRSWAAFERQTVSLVSYRILDAPG